MNGIPNTTEHCVDCGEQYCDKYDEFDLPTHDTCQPGTGTGTHVDEYGNEELGSLDALY